MSEYVSKQALLEWLDYDPNGDGNISKWQLRNAIQSGRFDAPSDDRLRAALERAQMALRKAHNYSALGWSIQDMLNFTAQESRAALEALSASTSEPTGAERVRELWASNTEEGNRADEEYLAGIVDTLNTLGYKIPGINAAEKEDKQ